MNNRWPLHPLPFKEEYLSSWVRRIAGAYNLSYISFCKKVLDINLLESKNIDVLPKMSTLKILSEGTGIPLKDIKKHTLYRYEGKLFNKVKQKNAFSQFSKVDLQSLQKKEIKFARLIPWLYASNDKIGERMQYCPICLNLDEMPYFRICWQLPIITICTKHLIHLIDTCWHCKRYIRLKYRVYKNPKLCYICNSNLCGVNIESANDYLRNITAYFNQAIIYGKATIFGKSYSAFHFMKIISAALDQVFRDNSFNSIVSIICYNIKITNMYLSYKNWFVQLNISDRIILLSLVGRLFERSENLDEAFHDEIY
jgi:hypothetical protein